MGSTIGCLPSIGGSIKQLADTGQHGRLLDYYFDAYLDRFERIYWFSYVDETMGQYPVSERVARKAAVIPNGVGTGSRVYTLTMPLRQHRAMKACDVMRVFHATGVPPAIAAKLRYGVPFVTTYGYRYSETARQAGDPGWKVRCTKALERLALRHADKIIVTTEELRSHVESRVGPERVVLIPNGVDTELFKLNGADCLMKRAEKGCTLVFVGRLEVYKDLPTMLSAAAQLMHRGFDLRIVLVGDGSLRQSLDRQARRLGVAVDFVGTLAHANLPALLGRADAFVLPSLCEGHPKALIEAMSCGVPCVVSDCEGNRSLVEHGGTGLLFRTGDALDLARRIEVLLGDPEASRGMGRRARAEVRKKYDLRRLLAQETDLLASLARQRSGRRRSRAA